MGHFSPNYSNILHRAGTIKSANKRGSVRPDRRHYLYLATASALTLAALPLERLIANYPQSEQEPFKLPPFEDPGIEEAELIRFMQRAGVSTGVTEDHELTDSIYLTKVRHFDENFVDDFYLPAEFKAVQRKVLGKILAVASHVGTGEFNVMSYPGLLKWADHIPDIGKFGKDELAFMEMLYEEDARRYGFQGEKVTDRLTHKISKQEIYLLRDSGQSLFRGNALDLYKRMKKDVGNNLIVTSGVRGVPKQMQLFLGKIMATGGNLSRASRSIAPPGYSWHGRGDFDVGRRGYGLRNFTSHFLLTPEYRKLVSLGYVKPRYPRDNRMGVRYEPWHIHAGESEPTAFPVVS